MASFVSSRVASGGGRGGGTSSFVLCEMALGHAGNVGRRLDGSKGDGPGV